MEYLYKILKLSLLELCCCRSFEELRKDINDTNLIYSTYTAACIARGLYTDDQEWHKIMTDAANTQKPKQMRHCFALLWVFENLKIQWVYGNNSKSI